MNNFPIAIVGMACRYPEADNADQLFENSLAQRRAFRVIPESRLNAQYFDESGKSPDRAYARQAAVLQGFEFDRSRFRVSRSSYEATDMTHWLALTVAREAIEDIPFRKHGVRVSNEAVRVIIGNTLTGEFSRAGTMRLRWPYVRNTVAQQLRQSCTDLDEASRELLLRDLEVRYKSGFTIPNEDYLAGGLSNTIAGRICNHFDFNGGGYTVDGACCSSLLAVTGACEALVSGDADLVLAGGVDLSIDPFELVGFSRTAALAHDEMRVYDEQSQGFWPGEGCGFVALMRYTDALEQCERIYAVIHGWGISSDGQGGLTRPESQGQLLALRRCYQRAGYGIASVEYFEGHGTGTKVGDAVELRALIEARRASGEYIQPAVISSIKANIGHTKAAAGLAGLLRAAKCIEKRILPPTTACPRPHPLFAGNADNLAPSDRVRAWELGEMPRRAGVSAMGFGGINTHITLEEPSSTSPKTASTMSKADLMRLGGAQDAELFLFAATTIEDLVWTIDHLAVFADRLSRSELTDLAMEMATRALRGAWTTWKAAVVAATPAELARELEKLKTALIAGGNPTNLSFSDNVFFSNGNAPGRIGLIFSGQAAPALAQGGAWARRFDTVRSIYEESGLDSFTNRDDTDFAQPAIVTASLAGLAVLQQLGIRGDVAVGHSLGELTALHWAGCFDAKDLQKIAKIRGKAMVDDPNTNGAMAAITASREETISLIAGHEGLLITGINSHRQTVIAGVRQEVESLVASLQNSGIEATTLRVRQAFHTPAMAGVASVLTGGLSGFEFRAAERKVVSTVTGNLIPPEIDVTGHLCRQLVSPVEFVSAVSAASRDVDLFIEVGPGLLFANLISGICKTPAISIDAGGPSLKPLLRAVAAAYVLNCTPMLVNLFNHRFARHFVWDWEPKFFQNPCESNPSEPEVQSPVEFEKPETEASPAPVLNESKDTRERLRNIIATRTGLPIWTLQDSSRMMSDLHLNSITVGEVVTQLTASHGLKPLVDPTEYADASIDKIAAAVDQLLESGGMEQEDGHSTPVGLESWVRLFDIERVEAAEIPQRRDLRLGRWDGFAATTPPAQRMLERLNHEEHGNGVIVWLSESPDEQELTPLLQAAHCAIERAGQPDEPLSFVVVQHGWGAGGFARTLSLENEQIRTLVINLLPRSGSTASDRILNEIDGDRPGFSEVFLDEANNRREEPRIQPILSSAALGSELLGEGDVVLVTGGGKGISAECGYQLALRTGCALLILGRSALQDNPELTNNLARLRNAVLRVSYQQADVTDAAQVAAAVRSGVADLGSSVTAIIHGAGMNVPRLVANLTLSEMKAAIQPKLHGLRNVLAAIHPDELKLLVSFSSIIGRIGLPGEADYALANEWLSRETEQFQSKYPQCRCRAIEWSVWSGTGMGQRLGRLDILARQGIAAISIDDGVREFLRLVDASDLPVRVVVSSRFGKLRTIGMDSPPPLSLRFLESIPVFYPGTELIAECTVSSLSDPYLDDHVLNGERLFPAVLALEAMTQVAAALRQRVSADIAVRFHNLLFRKAVVVPRDTSAEGMKFRILGLSNTNGEISLAIRCSTTGFQVNHIEARCVLEERTVAAHNEPVLESPAANELLPVDPAGTLYQNALFQKGRFQRVHGYDLIEARRCSGQLSMDGKAKWFSGDLSQTFLLGDPGARDAALHAVQACIPHKIVIPISVREVRCAKLDFSEAYRVVAEEVEDRGNELVYDMTIVDRNDRPIEQWKSVTLRLMGDVPELRLNSLPLMAPFVERKVAACMPGAGLKVRIERSPEQQWRKSAAIDLEHRPDGKLDAKDSRFRSTTYDGAWKLAVDSVIPVGCDLQSVSHRKAEEWEAMLGADGLRLAEIVATMAKEPLDIAAVRVWTVRESMKKAGLAAGTPLTVVPKVSAQWVEFKSGGLMAYSSLMTPSGNKAAVCLTVALLNETRSLTV